MSDKTVIKPLAIAVSAAFVTTLASTTVASAAANPFAMNDLSGGYMVAENTEGKCGAGMKTMEEGKCGEGMKTMEEGKCGEGKKTMEEGKCGEGKCGAGKKTMEEGKCGGAEQKAAE
jgi:uncharacterized low-complexity protein